MKKQLKYCKTYQFNGEDGDFGKPLRAMAQWVTRHPDVLVLSVGVETLEDGWTSVTLTVEELATVAWEAVA